MRLNLKTPKWKDTNKSVDTVCPLCNKRVPYLVYYDESKEILCHECLQEILSLQKQK